MSVTAEDLKQKAADLGIEPTVDPKEAARAQRMQGVQDEIRASFTTGDGKAASAPVNQRFKPEPAPRLPTPGMKLGAGAIVEDTPFHPSPSIAPQLVEVIEDYEEFAGYLTPALNALSSAVEGLKAIDAAWDALRKDTSKTDQQKSLVIAPAAEKKHDAIYKTFITAQDNLGKAVEQIEQELNKPIVTAATGHANDELREVIRGMKPEERNALIDTAVREGDETVVNAVLGVHHLITGIDLRRKQHWTRQVHEQRNPSLVRRLNATRKAIAVLERAAPIALGQVEKAMRMTFKDAAKLKGLSDASSAALAKLTG